MGLNAELNQPLTLGNNMSALILMANHLQHKPKLISSDRVSAIKTQIMARRLSLRLYWLVLTLPLATYVKMKQNACKRIGMESIAVELPDKPPQSSCWPRSMS